MQNNVQQPFYWCPKCKNVQVSASDALCSGCAEPAATETAPQAEPVEQKPAEETESKA
jgi:hypothetical protein